VKRRSKLRLILGCIALVVALFVIRPGAGRLNTRIANSIGMALQRQVEISKVHLRLLPQPGFDLDGFVVHDDPAFSAEPVLRAQEVTAFLRFSSLVRGRLEVSRLSLSDSSLNLVRRDDGRWNVENFLERTASIALAPTGKLRTESHPAFPYIQADHGRINFKFGREKKPFAVTDAEYAFWQDSENIWGMRLKGQPVRTDFNLSDTGQLKVNGTWQRAATVQETPVIFNLHWDGAQLGQMTKLISGEDRGWRGTVHLSLDLVGTPANLRVRSDGSLEDFRRYDITATTPLELKSHCEAHYSVSDHHMRQILCETPVGDGFVALSGEATNPFGSRAYDLQLTATKIPLNAMLSVIRRAKKDLPDDLQATGTVEARFSLRAASDVADSVAYQGGGRTSDFRLRSAASKTDVVLDSIPFTLVSAPPPALAGKSRARRKEVALRAPEEPRVTFGPALLKLGRPSPAAVEAWISRRGYSLSLKGDAELQHLLQIARATGLSAGHPAASGSAKLDLQIAGSWSGFASPRTTGSADLHAVKAEIRGLNGPVEISSAKVTLTDTDTKVDAIFASVADTSWIGSLSLPRGCSTAPSCPITFDLHADEISTDQLNEWLTPNPTKRPWYRFSSTTAQSGQSFLSRIHAGGTLSANRVVIRNLVANRVAAKVDLERGQLRLSDVRAEVLGGKHHGEWRANFSIKPPAYSGSGSLESASLAQLSEAMHDNWITGTANVKYQIDLAGYSSSEILDSAEGNLSFDMRDGALPHILVAALPLRVRHFTGILTLRQGAVQLQQATLESPTTNYAVTGKASMSRKLDFKLVPEGSPGMTVTGTLSEPRVSPVRRPETQAALKP
jgi:hypothetical protein